MAITVNMDGILAKIKTGPGARAIEKQVKPILIRELDTKKSEILQYFDNHLVTQELQAGPEAEGSIVTTDKGGNLFSFLGFYADEDPAGVLREKLDAAIQPKDLLIATKSTKKNTILTSLRVKTPTIPEISKEASDEVQLEWTDRDWVQTIEKGSSGFGSYLFKLVNKFKSSRSGTAIQAKNTLRDGSFRGVRYVSDVLAKARKILKGES